MVASHSEVDYVSAPETYSDLYLQYFGYVAGLVGKFGIEDHAREDVASEILLRFYERDFLKVYDPDMTFVRDGEEYGARFKPFLNAFVKKYVLSHRDRQNRRHQREILLCDAPQGDAETTWLEIYGASFDSDLLNFEDLASEAAIISRWRTALSAIPPKRKPYPSFPYPVCDLVALFDEVISQVKEDGTFSTKRVQNRFGISSTAAHSWLSQMRKALEPVR